MIQDIWSTILRTSMLVYSSRLLDVLISLLCNLSHFFFVVLIQDNAKYSGMLRGKLFVIDNMDNIVDV